MRALLERDLPAVISGKAFFRNRGFVGLAAAVGVLLAGTGARFDPVDVVSRQILTNAVFGTLLILAMVVPGAVSMALVGERRTNALEVLRSTPLTSWSAVAGLWLARVIPCLLYAAVTLPFIFLCLTLGGVTPAQCFAAAGLLILATLWFAAVGIFAGTYAPQAENAGRLALAITAVGCLTMPAIGSALAPSLAPAAAWVRAASPFPPLLDLVGDPGAGRVADLAGVWRHGVVAVLVTGGALGLAARAFRSARQERTGRVRLPSLLGGLLDPVLRRDPTLWLGLSRYLPGRLTTTTTLGLLMILVTEWTFRNALDASIATSGVPFGSAGAAGVSRNGLHATYAIGYGIAAFLVGGLSGATALFRELKTKTLEVLYATPLTNHDVVRGLWAGAVSPALPIVLLASLHAVVGSFDGAIPFLSTGVFLVTFPLIYLNAVALATGVGFQSRSATKAVARVMLLYAVWTASLLGGFCLLFLVWLHPVALAFGPLVLVDQYHLDTRWMLLGLVGAILYASILRKQVERVLPDRFVVRIDPRLGIRSKLRRQKWQHRARKPGGHERSL